MDSIFEKSLKFDSLIKTLFSDRYEVFKTSGISKEWFSEMNYTEIVELKNPYVVSESISRSNYISFRYPVLRSSYNSVRFDGSCQCFPIVGCFNERKQSVFCDFEAERCSYFLPPVRLPLHSAQISALFYYCLMLCARQLYHVYRGHHVMAISTTHVHL